MTEGERLYRQILDEPEADDVRLVYADWLEENAGAVPCKACRGRGRMSLANATLYEKADVVMCPTCHGEGRVDDGRGLRAEFIRVQIERAKPCRLGYSDRWHVDDYCPACEPPYLRERHLWATHGRELVAMSGWAESDMMVRLERNAAGHQPLFPLAIVHRGFVDEVTLPLNGFFNTCQQLFEALPITKVKVANIHPYCREYGGGWEQWSWHRSNYSEEFWEMLCPGGQDSHFVECGNRREDAWEYLSRACVTWGTSKRSWRR